ncbi:unnamed protein product, partial [Ixodes pacificus]
MGNPCEASASGGPGTRATSPPPVFHISGRPLSSDGAPLAPVDIQVSQPLAAPPGRQPSLDDGSLATETTLSDQSDSVSSGQEATSRPHDEAPASDPAVPRGETAASNEEARRLSRGLWSHDLFSVFATFFSVFGLFSVTRFSILVYIYKGKLLGIRRRDWNDPCFILQFFVLSSVFGVPFLYLQMSLGQYLGSGILDMWYISPAFKGVGVALVLVYFVCGVYFAVPVSWLFFYFRDSFIKARDSYRWSVCQTRFASNGCYKHNVSSPEFLGWTTASYFHGRVLDRRPQSPAGGIGELRFELAFNLGIIWLLVFIALSRGLKSFGKILSVLGMLSMCLLVFITIRMTEQWGGGISSLFRADWKGVLADANSWVVAAREVFLTWGLFGALAFHVNSHNKFSTNVTRNMICVTTLVCTVLVLVASLFASIAHLLRTHGMVLVSSSFGKCAPARL